MTISLDHVELDFRERLTIAVGRTGRSQRALAAWLEMNPASVSRWFMGATVPPGRTLRLIAIEAGVPYEWLRPTDSEKESMGRNQYTPRDLNPEPTD